MLDLVFAVLMITVLVKAMHGVMCEKLVSAATIIGTAAGILGIAISAFGNSFQMLILNIIVLAVAIFLKRAAQHLIKLYNDKQEEHMERMCREHERYTRESPSPKPPVYTEENFDDPDIRFSGKFKEYK